MAQVCFGTFRHSPEVGVIRRRGYCHWRGATLVRRNPYRVSSDFSPLDFRNSLKFEIAIRRPLTVSGGEAAYAAHRPELEALGG